MAQSQSGYNSPNRVAWLTSEAKDDRLITYLYTEQIWGTRQADAYDAFLVGILQDLADQPGIGSRVENTTGIRRYFARWKQARNGQHIFYEQIPDGILVLRILHSSMSGPDHLG